MNFLEIRTADTWYLTGYTPKEGSMNSYFDTFCELYPKYCTQSLDFDLFADETLMNLEQSKVFSGHSQ